jgi:hypothetical protein
MNIKNIIYGSSLFIIYNIACFKYIIIKRTERKNEYINKPIIIREIKI